MWGYAGWASTICICPASALCARPLRQAKLFLAAQSRIPGSERIFALSLRLRMLVDGKPVEARLAHHVDHRREFERLDHIAVGTEVVAADHVAFFL